MAKARTKEKKHKNQKPVKMWELYENGKIKNKFCPKCGLGVAMGNHKNRNSCGKCGYTEFKK